MQGVVIWHGHKGGHVNAICQIGLNRQKARQDVLLTCLARVKTTSVVNVGSGTKHIFVWSCLVVVQWSAKRTPFAQFLCAAALVGAKVSLNTNCWIALSFETASNGFRIETGCRCRVQKCSWSPLRSAKQDLEDRCLRGDRMAKFERRWERISAESRW